MLGVGAKAIAEKEAESQRQANHLPAEAPDAAADRTHVAHEPRRGPCGAELNHGAARPGDADVQRREANGQQKGDELS